MEGRLVLKDCSLFRSDGRVRTGMALVVAGDSIAKIAPDAEVPVLPGDWAVACKGRLVSPGFTDSHTRLVNGQLASRRADVLLGNQDARLDRDLQLTRGITPSEIEALTAFALARGVRRGVTSVVEHLLAPGCVLDGLGAQARAAERLGLRLLNSHASSSDLEGLPGPAQVEANALHAKTYKAHPHVRGQLGFHSSNQADDELLRAAGHAKEELGVGVHFRLAETDEGLAATWSRYGVREVNRYETFGLLGASSIAAHGKAIGRTEAQRLARTRTMLSLCLRASSTDSMGGASTGVEAALAEHCLVGLGTDGTGALLADVDVAHAVLLTLTRAGRTSDPDAHLAAFFLGGPAELSMMIFGRPSGVVERGALADLLVFDFVPADSADDLPHLFMQLSQAPVAWAMVNGRVVVREGTLLGGDYGELAREAAKATGSVWKRAGLAA